MLNVDYSMLVTVLYVIILYLFLSRIFFQPLVEILNKRRELIEGRMEESRKRLQVVEKRTAEYEEAIRNARTEAYRHQELQRDKALSEKAELVAKAKKEAEAAVQAGRVRLTAQAEEAQKQITVEVDSLAKKLTTAILRD
ncbi:MAG TPA: ATP synthase F0 subunit B [Terriglobia bacterium]|nr:ATP synthase F0 subunit B [Terriglobia bacterium]